MNQYFYFEGNTQKGPVSLEELVTKITPETDVWTQGMVDWAKAKDVPEVATALSKTTGFDTVQPQQKVPVITVQTQNSDRSSYDSPDFHNLLIWAIVSTFLCCNITGVIGIVMDLKAEIEWVKGNKDKAWDKYKTAKMWIIIGAVLMVIFYIFYFAVLQSVFVNNFPEFR